MNGEGIFSSLSCDAKCSGKDFPQTAKWPLPPSHNSTWSSYVTPKSDPRCKFGKFGAGILCRNPPAWVSDHAVENAKIKKKLQASSKTNAQFEWKLPSEYAAIWNLRLHQMVFLNTTRARNNVKDETETFCETKY